MLKFQSWHQPPQHLISIYQPYDLLMHPHYQIQWLSGHPSWQSLIDIPWTNGITLQPCTTFRGCQMGQHKVGQYLTESESIAICFKQINYILNQIKLWTKGVLTIMHDIVVTSAINLTRCQKCFTKIPKNSKHTKLSKQQILYHTSGWHKLPLSSKVSGSVKITKLYKKYFHI